MSGPVRREPGRAGEGTARRPGARAAGEHSDRESGWDATGAAPLPVSPIAPNSESDDAAAAKRAPGRARPRSGEPVDPGPVPTAGRLREAALAHLARFAATEAGLVRVLDRKIARWSRQAGDAGRPSDEIAAAVREAREAVRAVAASLAGARVVDDAAFAESRARSLSRGGRSRRAIGAHLAGRGVAPELIETALEEAAGSDLRSAVLQARRRRIGPFGDPAALDDPAAWNKALAALARAGFDRDTAERALRMDPQEAEAFALARHAL
ncbi:RecX family transcriptional regulator [Acetobacteraceae bacterium KSS8]|uniref:Regulatory protein RecX n=1 Tax=Endosaccharibacter trunci TaxID=2812733 RepID=A0ABT1W9A3_9PROT|nr:RecX family transcriptional regulator [Acetobacteraceae bacterium KSS8]